MRRALVVLSALLLTLMALVSGGVPATAAAVTADLQIQKSVDSPGPYGPGDTFAYTIVVGCSSTNEAGCFDTVLSDALPEPLELDPAFANPVTAVLSPAGPAGVSVDGDSFTVEPRHPVGDRVGLRAGSSMTVTVQVRVPTTVSADFNGDEILNTAVVVAENAEEQRSTAAVTLEVETTLEAGVSKSVTPGTVPATPGKRVSWTLEPSNQSNQTVDRIVVEDRFDGTNWSHLDFAGITTDPAPESTDDTTVEYLVEGTWTTDQPSDLATVEGVRVTYEGTYAPGTEARVGVATVTNATVSSIEPGTTVAIENETSATVEVGDDVSDPATDEATARIQASDPTVSIEKSLSDTTLVVGQGVTATVTATVGEQDVHELVINEPSAGTSTFTEQGLAFTGFSDVEWPVDAQSAEITYTYADCASTTGSTTTEDTLPAPRAGCIVEGFTVTYSAADGSDGIQAAAYAQLGLEFTALTDLEDTLQSTNVVDVVVANVDGARGTDEADASFQVRPLEVLTEVDKRITPGAIFGVPGAEATVSVPGSVSSESTIGSNRLVIQDPADPAAGSEFFDDHFDPTAISNTEIPGCTQLTVRYWDGASWVALPGAENVAGNVANWSYTIPAALRDEIGGIQFEFTPLTVNGCPQLLPAGFNVIPSFEVEVQAGVDLDDELVVANDVRSEVFNQQIDKGDTALAEDDVTLRPIDGDGPDLVDKEWLQPTVPALSGQTRTARIHWSTQGLNFANVTITDPASPAELGPDSPGIETSVYDAFDLVAIKPITASTDPLIVEDVISKVELYLDGTWTDITSQACPSAAVCAGRFPGHTLSAAQRSGTTGVRITYTERQAAEGVGSSVDRRPLDLDFAVRDNLRSDPDEYVLGNYHDHTYNTSDPGVVDNTVNARGSGGRSGEFSSSDGDRITILDAPFNVDLTKEFDQSVIGLPSPDNAVDPGDFPLISATLRATNASASKLSSLVISDPGVTSTDTTTYDVANLYDIDSITIPAGAAQAGVTVTLDRSGTPTDYGYDEALALTSAELADVTGVTVSFVGAEGAPLILSAATGEVALTWQLRAEKRSGGPVEATSPGGVPILNEASVQIDSPGRIACPATACSTGYDDADDEFNIVSANYSITAQKVIRPDANPTGDTVYEDQATTYTTSLRGQPLGSARTTLMRLTDETETFWNTMNLTSASINLPRPINSVRMDAKVGDVWVEGLWVNSLSAPANFTFALPPGVTDASVVEGVRFSFRQLDAGGRAVQWERPYNPNIVVSLRTERRDTQRENGEPVSTTLPGLAPNQGEGTPGLISDDLQVHGDAQFGATQTFTDDASAADTTQVLHRPNRIRVEKTPGNASTPPQFTPNGTIPYVLRVTNTGQWAMTGFEVSDQIELVGGEVPVREPDPTAYSFALTTTNQSNPVPSPTPTFAASLGPETGLLAVTTPDDFEFRPGWVLTVQAPLVLKSSIEADQIVGNSVTATSDRDFEVCQYTVDAVTQANRTNVDSCTATTHVQPRSSATLAMVKGVKGVEAGEPGSGDDDLGVVNTAGPASACAEPDEDGYHRGTCLPVTRPGGEASWKLAFRNTGNTNAKLVVLVDTLPAVGDRGVITSAARGSQFDVRLLHSAAADLAAVQHQGATLRAFFSTQRASIACNTNAVQVHTANAAPLAGCGFGWTEYDQSTPDAQLAAAQSVKFVLDWTSAGQGAGLRPGETAGVTFSTRTPVNLPRAFDQATALPTAYNSFAGSARSVATVTQPERAEIVLEPTRVGIATAQGRLTIDKVVEAPDFSVPVDLPGTYSFRVSCTLDGTDVVLRNAAGTVVDGTVVVSVDDDGGSTVVNTSTAPVSIPLFARCTVAEDPIPAGVEVTWSPADRTAVADASLSSITQISHPYEGETDGPTVAATNTYAAGGFTVAKSVDNGGAVDQDGSAIVYDRTYDFEVTCAYLGATILDERIELEDAGTRAYSGLPTGASCSVEETDAAGASVTVQIDGEEADNPAEFTIGNDTTVSVAHLNTYTVGAVNITKQITGPGKDRWDDQEFEVRLVCTLDLDGEGAPETVFDDSAVLTAPDDLTWAVENLPTGAACTVSEPRNGGANQTTIDPQDFTVGSGGQAVEVGVENYFEQGVVQVRKSLSGDGAQFPVVADGTYVMSLECVREVDGTSTPVTIPGGADRTITGAGTAEWDRLPTGATCTVSEKSSTPQSQGVTMTPAGGEVVVSDTETEEPVEVVVDNRFDAGFLRVNKLIDGPGAGLHDGASYEFDVACTLAGETVLQDEVTLDRRGGSSSLWSDAIGPLPTGTSCHVVETEDGDADGSTREATVVIAAGTQEESVVATITNTYGAGAVEVTKQVEGRFADRPELARTAFAMTLTCQLETKDASGASVLGTVFEADFTLRPDRTKSFTGADGEPLLLPTGTRCFAEETDDGGASEVRVSHPDFAGGATVESVDTTAQLEIVVTNVFDEDVWSQESESGDGGTAGDGELADSGSGVSPLALGVGLLSLLAGGAAVAGARRRSRADAA
ncbi:DUF5979 domain-containing protein [Aeromicrobium choanae]|uniref:Conserved repeat domain-containing protein n=1 Tax=Aeromicrobium choanae TaxID=1736691 RepID=A0A1T4Z0E3_9ACTN|nr:DUF5979 domain-containing protein [Aeromicrobium choanae]SKB07278.1 conserved repeat domain-containing protein [Aeromicrobium choanae]